MLKLAIISVSLFASSLASARGGGATRLPVCTGHEPPRQGAEYTRNPSFEVKIQAYQKLLDVYESQPDTGEFGSNARAIEGRSCFEDKDCSTTDESKFSGKCERYVWDGTNGTCHVTPLIDLPIPPPKPVFTCADVICPSNTQCEVEAENQAVGCVEPRTCVPSRHVNR